WCTGMVTRLFMGPPFVQRQASRARVTRPFHRCGTSWSARLRTLLGAPARRPVSADRRTAAYTVDLPVGQRRLGAYGRCWPAVNPSRRAASTGSDSVLP